MGAMHVDAALARRLVTDQVARLDPEVASAPLRTVGRGWDNLVVRLGERLVLRLPGDLHPHNLVAATHGLAGILDFGDLTSGDPATDLATVWWTFDVADRERCMRRIEASGRYDRAVWTRAAGWAAAVASAIPPGSPMLPFALRTADQLASHPVRPGR